MPKTPDSCFRGNDELEDPKLANMPIFQYKAYTAAGKEAHGDIEAESFKGAGEALRKSGLFPKEILSPEKALEKAPFADIIKKGRSVSALELASFTRQLSTLLSSGSALFDALAVLSSEQENAEFAKAVVNVKESVAGGSSLARSLQAAPKIFPEMYVRTVEAGEASGSLDEALSRLADLLEARARVADKVSSALIYPAIMTGVGILVLFFLFIFVIPKITAIFDDMEQALPLITRVLVGVSWLVKTLWPLGAAIAAILWWLAPRYIKRPEAKAFFDRLVFKLPMINSLVIKFYMASFSRTLGSLLGSNVPILVSLDITKRVLNNAIFDPVISKSIKDVTEGHALSASLKSSGLFSGMLCHMIVTGEKSGELPGLLLKAAAVYEKEFDTGVERGLSLLEPVLILIMGAIVGFVVLAVLLPIFELNQAIR
ncbi:MAG: type II secretion system F family protein [Deltaproteobacteria bacterium]